MAHITEIHHRTLIPFKILEEDMGRQTSSLIPHHYA